MVSLTMTASMAEALEKIRSLENSVAGKGDTVYLATGDVEGAYLEGKGIAGSASESADVQREDTTSAMDEDQPSSDEKHMTKENLVNHEEPALSDPKVGNPITHGQILDLSQQMKSSGLVPSSLDTLLRGSRVYISPPPAKPEPTPEYKALMARLRREEELRAYDRMINPPPPMQSVSQKVPASSATNAFAADHEPLISEDDDITFADINRQMTLILNVLISIVACGGAIWMIARWWPTPSRLAISMGGSILVGIAEVVVYGGYLRRVGEAKGKEKNLKEVKEVVKTWVVGGGEENEETGNEPIKIQEKEDLSNIKRRKRKEDVS